MIEIDWEEFGEDLKQSEKEIEDKVYNLREDVDFDKRLDEAYNEKTPLK